MKISRQKIELLKGKMTQEEFAKRAGLSYQGFNQILARGTCKASSVYKIARALNVPPEDILKEEP